MYKILTLLFVIIATKSTSFALTGGSGVSVSNGSISTDSNTTGFLSNSSSLTCSSSDGKMIIDTTAGTLAWCSTTLKQSALGDDNGNSLTGDTATGFFSSGILESSIGGTGNGFTKFSGPTTSEKTFTLPNSSSTIFTNNTTTMTIASGGALSAASGATITATSVDPGTSTGTDGSRIITMPDNVSATPSPPAANKTNIYSRSGVGYIQPNHVASGWGYQIQASQVALGSNSTQALSSTTLTNLTSISFDLKANKKYWIQGSLSATPSAATADPQFAVNFSTTAGTPIIAIRGSCTFNAGTSAITSFVLTANNTAGICTISTANDITAILDGYVSPGTSDATLTVRASPNGTGTLTIAAYPLFRVTEFQ